MLLEYLLIIITSTETEWKRLNFYKIVEILQLASFSLNWRYRLRFTNSFNRKRAEEQIIATLFNKNQIKKQQEKNERKRKNNVFLQYNQNFSNNYEYFPLCSNLTFNNFSNSIRISIILHYNKTFQTKWN